MGVWFPLLGEVENHTQQYIYINVHMLVGVKGEGKGKGKACWRLKSL